MTKQPGGDARVDEGIIAWARRLVGWTQASIVLAVLAIVLGAFGWHETDPTLPLDEIAYRTLALFAISFDSVLPPSIALNAARFLALGVVYVAVVRVAIEVLARRGALGRASRMRNHTVVLGCGAEAGRIASRLRLRSAQDAVTLVGELSVTDRKQIERDRVTHVAGADRRAIRRILKGATRVIVAEPDDHAAAETLNRVRMVDEAAPVTVLVEEPELAELWGNAAGTQSICRSSRAALATLRSVPPFLGTAMVPPPVVVGEGPLAAEVIRRIVLGWQQPGERIVVHSVTRTAYWHPEAVLGIEDRVELRTTVGPRTARQIGLLVAELSREYAAPVNVELFTVDGPSVYVVHGVGTTSAPIAQAVVDACPTARVAAIVEDAAIWGSRDDSGNPCFLALHELLSDPKMLLIGPVNLLVDEIRADDAWWPVPSRVFDGRPPTIVERVATVALAILSDAGIVAHPAHDLRSEPVVMNPAQLRTIADGLQRELATMDPGFASDPELQVRLIEFAARLPVLAGRAGIGLSNTDGEGFRPEEVERLAGMVHERYQQTGERTSNATGSINARRAFTTLSDVDRRSNVAQLVDIPVKLAVEGLGWRRVSAPRELRLTTEQVERLARLEHRRWHHFQLRNGRPGHPLAVDWEALTDSQREYDRDAVRSIPDLLAAVGIEIVMGCPRVGQ